MKYAMVIPDGAADEPSPRLDGRTPLEVAKTPHIDWISTNGRQGRVVTVPAGFTPATDVATLSLLGYDPRKNYTGRAPIEAVAQGISVGPSELIFRCNFVTVVDGAMADFTAGHIGGQEARLLIADLNRYVADASIRFHTGLSYRNLMTPTDSRAGEARCTPPHDIPGRKVADWLPSGSGADWLRAIMERAAEMLENHDVNLVRRDLGENPATDIWLWGQGRPMKLEPFAAKYRCQAAVIAGVDVIRGLAISAGLELIPVEGATGYLDTDYAAKGEAAVSALDRFDLVIVHIEAPDEAGHLGDPDAKIAAIERIDELIVGPLLERLRACDRWRILVAPDHPTPVDKQTHTSEPPPFCLAGHGVHTVLNRPLTEASAAASDLQIDPGYELMEYFLRA